MLMTGWKWKTKLVLEICQHTGIFKLHAGLLYERWGDPMIPIYVICKFRILLSRKVFGFVFLIQLLLESSTPKLPVMMCYSCSRNILEFLTNLRWKQIAYQSTLILIDLDIFSLWNIYCSWIVLEGAGRCCLPFREGYSAVYWRAMAIDFIATALTLENGGIFFSCTFRRKF